MVHRDFPAADPPIPTPAGVPIDQTDTGDSILLNRSLGGGLRVRHRLGSTREGPLYQAEYPNGVEVALVLLRPQVVRDEPSRFERLVRATQIRHPNVAAIYDVGGMEDGSVYVVLEQLDGEPLSNLLAAGHTFVLREALDLALQVAAGLQAAHGRGFVHGNLSPHTVVITGAVDERSQVKLIGFTADASLGQRGAKPSLPEALSAGYASPERLSGQPPDERSDVFSLGAVVHHLLTGRSPDRGRVDGSVPEVARVLLDTALASAPDRRFQTISELDQALRRVAAASTKTAAHRALLVGAVAAGLALVTGGMWLLPGLRWASEAVPAAATDTTDLGSEEPDRPTVRESPRALAPTRSATPAPAAARQDTVRTPDSEAERDGPPVGVSAEPAPRASRPRSAPAARLSAEADGAIGPAMVGEPPPEEPSPPTMEDRAQVYLRIGLDEASRQLGRPVHVIEGMTPLFLGLARSRFPGYSATGPAVRVVYMGPNGSLILLDQQRVRSGRSEPAPTATRWRIGDVMLYLHGEAPPLVLSNFARRVR